MVKISEIKSVFMILNKDHQPTMLEQLSNNTPFQMLIATLLSSRTKDSVTIPIVKKLFEKFPRPEDYSDMDVKQLEELLFGIGFYRIKARNIKKLSGIILEKYGGGIPNSFEGLTSLPGVGRKTANCIIAYTFNKPAIAVDVHVHRISNRLGWVKTKAPEEAEESLKRAVPRPLWREVNKLFVDFGQRVCLPVKPRCKECKIQKYCDYYKRADNNERKI